MRGVAGDGADPAPTPQTPLLPCSEENLAQIWLHASGSLGGTFQPSRGMLHPPPVCSHQYRCARAGVLQSLALRLPPPFAPCVGPPMPTAVCWAPPAHTVVPG